MIRFPLPFFSFLCARAPRRWLRDHEKEWAAKPKEAEPQFRYLMNNGYSSGRSNASIKLSSNAVWRC